MDNNERNEQVLIKKCTQGWRNALLRFQSILTLAPVGLKSSRNVFDVQEDPVTREEVNRSYSKGDLVPDRHDDLAAKEGDDEATKLDKGAKRALRNRNIAASEAYQLEVETSALIDAAQAMLSFNASLKEAWLFGKLNTLGQFDAEKKTEEHARVVAELLPQVVNGADSGINGRS